MGYMKTICSVIEKAESGTNGSSGSAFFVFSRRGVSKNSIVYASVIATVLYKARIIYGRIAV